MVQRSPSHFQTGTFYWAHVRSCVPFLRCFSSSIRHSSITLAYPKYSALAFCSTRNYASSTRLLHSWVDWISALGGKTRSICRGEETNDFLSCFRWDTAQHVLTDDTSGTDRSEIWPGTVCSTGMSSSASTDLPRSLSGKDYSNPRMSDFYNLHKPEEDMYDRTKVPRMPW